MTHGEVCALTVRFFRVLQQCLALVVLWLCAASAGAQTPCPVAELTPDTAFRIDLGPYACVMADDGRALDLPTVMEPETGARFDPVAAGLVDFGFGTARYWVRVKLHNAGDGRGTWWITHDIPMADRARVRMVPGNGGPVQTLLDLSGEAPFFARPVPHRHLVSTVSLGAGETAEIVIDYVTGQGTQMPLAAESVGSFIDRTQGEMAQHLLIIALVLGMGAISTLYFYSLEGPPGLIYGAYVLSVALMLAHMEGYGFQLLYPRAVYFNIHAFPMLGFGSLALGMLFVSRLTRIREHARVLHALVLVSVVLLLLLVVTAPVLLSEAWYKVAGLLIAGMTSVVQVVVIFRAMRRGQSGAWLLLTAFAATSAAIVLVATGYLTEGLFPQELAGSAIRFSFLLEAMAFSGAIALRIREARRARDRSLREQLRLTKESLRLSEAVQKAEAERLDAEEDAQRSRVALSSAAHDIRQPLTSIQMLLAEGALGSPDIAGNITYIEDILRKGLEADAEPLGAGSRDPVIEGAKETFPATLVLRNIATMFESDARQRGVDLRVVPSSADIVADPLSVMRASSNLVSNALKHANATRILIGCRRRNGALTIEVHDDGVGMSDETRMQVSQRGRKGADSDGHGLGLSIIHDLAERQGIVFSLSSKPGRGTRGILTIPTTSGWAEDRHKDA